MESLIGMEKHPIEAFLDNRTRKMIADEFRLLYGSVEGDIPQYMLDLLKTLDGQTQLSRATDETISTTN